MNSIALRVAQGTVGVVGVAGGYMLGSSAVRGAWQSDLTSSPSRIVDMSDQWIVDQPRQPQAGTLTNALTLSGAAVAGVGVAIALRKPPAQMSGLLAKSAAVAGAAMFAAGTGTVTGALTMTKRFDGAEVRPNR